MVISKFLKLVTPVALISALALTSCKREMSPDDPFPEEFSPSIFFASDNRIVFSVNIQNLNTNWEFVTDEPVKASPTIFKNSVIVVTQNGIIYKLNKINGELEQTLPFGSPVTATPIIWNDKLIIAGVSGKITAFNGNDLLGDPFWTVSGKGAIAGSPTIDRHVEDDFHSIYFTTATNEIFALDEEDGDELWRAGLPLGGGIISALYASPTLLYVTSNNGRLYCLNSENGSTSWSFETGGPIVSSPICVGGNIMFGSFDMNFYSVDSITGTLRWKVETGDKIVSSPYYDNQYVYFGSADQHIYCVDVINGLVTWKKRTFGAITSSPVVYNKTLYIQSMDKNMYILDSETGQEKGLIQTVGQADCSPIVDIGINVYYPPVSGNYMYK